MPTIDDALALASQGWRVLPLHGKTPRTAHGVKDATADPEQVARWWAGGARHNVGARVPGHLVVLDCDPRNGGTLDVLEAANGGPLPVTLTVYSGRGDGGRHLYYRHPGGKLTQRLLPAGVDVKTESGYCVLPPSIHPDTGRAYSWGDVPTPATFPPGLLELVRPPAPAPAPFPASAPAGRGSRDRLAKRARYLAEHMARAGEGQRNARLHWATCEAIRCGYPAEAFDLLADAARHCGLGDTEIARTMQSARRTMRSGS